MKNENYSGKHGSDGGNHDSAPSSRRSTRENFKVHISEEDLAVGSDYKSVFKETSQNNINDIYNLDNFVSSPSSADNARAENRRPHSEEINSFSNDSAKNTAMRHTKAELKQQKKEIKRRRKEKDKGNRRIFRIFWIAACLVVGIFLGQYLLVGFNDFLAINRTSEDTVTVEIGENPDIDSVAEILAEKGVINSKTYFKIFAALTKKEGDFRQGTFEISTNLDYQAIISFLQSNSNRSDIVTVRFTEGMNVIEIADKLKENGVITDTEEFLELCNTDRFDDQFTFLKDTDNEDKYYKLEGYLFPDTYDFYINENPVSVIEKMINNYENRVYYYKIRVPGYDKQIAIGKLLRESEYSADEIMIIASIIQAEALSEEDMYNISSVIHNRLNSDPDLGVLSLNCDSTVYYPYRTKSEIPSELEGYVSRYDTYTIQGLPAGAICNPGTEAILAALMPNDTNYLYFCHSAATEDTAAQAYYASTLYEHEYNLVLAGLSDGE